MEATHEGQLLLQPVISLILLHVGAVGACSVSVTQPQYLEVDLTHKAVTIECTFSMSNCPRRPTVSLWFLHGTQQPKNLCFPHGCRSEADKYTVREALAQNQVSLTVNRVTSNDSAIYICGIAAATDALEPRARQTGEGTMLVVRESKLLSREVQSLLTALLVLLSVYIAGICIIFIILSKAKSHPLRNRETKEDAQKKKSARRIFHEIAQELYHKRYVATNPQPDKDNSTYENQSALSNRKSP
ncbi:immunoglobulin superfamily member 6 isoform X2 [Ochotona curzoniae]|uniref:immunoglobulin superfamily member 6 isoform X2 n=1 Tax=Ochotona curzoniae TaxID=130825 RepID=UPI001B354221|nr:immunoglobulin superfamily member 6 isoform X2 [Ochotona curzoniae]